MTDLTRRGFLASLTAALATPVLPQISEGLGGYDFVMEDQALVLSEKLVIEGHQSVFIRNCHFFVAPGFEGETMLELHDAKRCIVMDCNFTHHSFGSMSAPSGLVIHAAEDLRL